MKKLDLFIIKSFLGPFIMTFIIVLFVLVMQFLWLYIDELIGKGLSFGIIIEFLAWGSATLFPLTLPLATLLASIMTLGSFGENNELLAMKAAGISLPRILAPLTIIALLISIAAFFASNNLIPVAYDNIYNLRSDIRNTKEEIKIPTGIFYNGVEGYSIRVVSRDDNNIMHNIMVYNHSKGKGNVSLTIADSGKVKLTPDKSSILFTLYNGVNYEEDNKINYSDTTLTLQKINFNMQEVIIPLENYAFKKSEESKYSGEVITKGLSQLRIDKDSLTKVYNTTLETQTNKALVSNKLNFTSQLDTSVEVQQKFKGLINVDTLFKWENTAEELKAYSAAIKILENQVQDIDFYRYELGYTAYSLRRTILESYRKFALSIACLIFFFIGAPLGAIIRKGGLGTPVIISILFFVIYWVIDTSGKKLCNGGSITPFIGAFISTFVLLPISIFLTWKSTKDSALFNADIYINAIKKLFNKFSKYKQNPM